MIVVLKGFFWKFNIDISKYNSNFESRQFQSISAKVLRLGLAPLAFALFSDSKRSACRTLDSVKECIILFD